MNFLRHLEACNRFDPDRFLPLILADRRVGFVRRDRASALAGTGFVIEDRAIRFAAGLASAAEITNALDETVETLIARGLLSRRRGEAFAVTDRWGGRLLFELDRGAVPFFGTRSYGVHLNGYRPGPDGLDLWIGRRAADKKVAPDKLDNLVAGGIGSGYDAHETLLKEAAEEADIPEKLARRARPVGAMMYRMEQPDGMRDDVLFSYDLAVPADFTPRNTDGEIASFQIMPLAECLARVAETDDFKFNVNLVLIDFAIRHGAIGPDHPEYLALLQALHGGLMRGPE
jgi:8-oxo-dGTP pyrophosphatase MutT (NUDIX family)